MAQTRAVVGGTASRVTGGKFANGAAMGAFRSAVQGLMSRGGSGGGEQNALSEEEQEYFARQAAYDRDSALAFQPPSLPQGVVNFAAGFGDGIVKVASFGFGDLAATRQALGIDGGVDASSAMYSGAYAGGAGVGLLATGGAINTMLRPATLYHFTSLESAAAIRSSGVIAEGAGLYGRGVYATAFNSAAWARLSGAASTQTALSFSTNGLRVAPTFFPGTFRVLSSVPR